MIQIDEPRRSKRKSSRIILNRPQFRIDDTANKQLLCLTKQYDILLEEAKAHLRGHKENLFLTGDTSFTCFVSLDLNTWLAAEYEVWNEENAEHQMERMDCGCIQFATTFPSQIDNGADLKNRGSYLITGQTIILQGDQQINGRFNEVIMRLFVPQSSDISLKLYKVDSVNVHQLIFVMFENLTYLLEFCEKVSKSFPVHNALAFSEELRIKLGELSAEQRDLTECEDEIEWFQVGDLGSMLNISNIQQSNDEAFVEPNLATDLAINNTELLTEGSRETGSMDWRIIARSTERKRGLPRNCNNSMKQVAAVLNQRISTGEIGYISDFIDNLEFNEKLVLNRIIESRSMLGSANQSTYFMRESTQQGINFDGIDFSRDKHATFLTHLLSDEKDLSSLSLRYCKLSLLGIQKLAALLRQRSNSICHLNLCGNDSLRNSNAAAIIGNVLNLKENLVSINLQECMLASVGVTLVAQSLFVCKALRSLNLAANLIEGSTSGCTALAEALGCTSTLTYLNISRNILGIQGVKQLCDALLSNSSLLYFDISRQRLKGKFGTEGCNYIAKLITDRVLSLEVLRMGRNRIGLEGCRRIAEAVLIRERAVADINEDGCDQRSTALRALDMSFNKVSVEGAIQLATMLTPTANPTVVYRLEALALGSRVLPLSVLIKDADSYSEDHKFKREVYYSNDLRNLEIDEIHGVQVFRRGDGVIIIDLHAQYNSEAENIIKCTDEEAGFLGHLLIRRKCSSPTLVRVETCYLPIREIRGDVVSPIQLGDRVLEPTYHLDLSYRSIGSADAIIIGMLLINNPILRTLNLKGNDFNTTEGESWISAALDGNPSVCLDTNAWPAEEVFTDGYKQLAARKGLSASGTVIEPQLLDTMTYKVFAIVGCLSYYLDLGSDVYVTYIYETKNDVYNSDWLALTVLFLCLPTIMTIGSIIWTTMFRDFEMACLQIFVVIFQVHPILYILESLKLGIEITAWLDLKYLEGVYENIPQIVLQTFIMFEVSVTKGAFDLPILISVIISLLSVSSLLSTLQDRARIRKFSLARLEDNPYGVRALAFVITFFLKIIAICIHCPTTQWKNRKLVKWDDINYLSLTNSHYCWGILYQFTTLSVRVISITWLLAVAMSYKYVVLITVLLNRLLLGLLFDPMWRRRSIGRSIIWTLVYCLITGVWDRDERNLEKSRTAFLVFNIFETLEDIVCVCYSAFLTTQTAMDYKNALIVFGTVLLFKILSWFFIIHWKLTVHFTDLTTLNMRSILRDKKSDRNSRGSLPGNSTKSLQDSIELTFVNENEFNDSAVGLPDTVSGMEAASFGTSNTSNNQQEQWFSFTRGRERGPTVEQFYYSLIQQPPPDHLNLSMNTANENDTGVILHVNRKVAKRKTAYFDYDMDYFTTSST